MDKRKNYYLILGVPRDATTATIKRAYRRLAKKFHPDINPASASQDFTDLQAAYETLTDRERRQRYDEGLTESPNEFDALAWSFVRSPTVGDLRRPVHPGSLSGEILLSPREAAEGGILPLDVPLTGTCPACGGTGGFVFDCGRCEGEGKVERRLPIPVRIPKGIRDGAVFQVSVDDPAVLSVLLTIHIRHV